MDASNVIKIQDPRQSARTTARTNMVHINADLCKGCGLCVKFCPRNILQIGQSVNTLGYQAVIKNENSCTGCGNCYYICPEPAAICVHKNVPVTTPMPESPQKRVA